MNWRLSYEGARRYLHNGWNIHNVSNMDIPALHNIESNQCKRTDVVFILGLCADRIVPERLHQADRETFEVSNLREPLAGTALASLEWNENAEKAIDRVAASGKASKFGIDLWKAKYLLESACLFSAQDELILRLRERYTSVNETMAIALCEQAMHEYLSPNCHTCNGAGEIMFDDLKVICSECNGSRVHRYSDPERARMMKVSYESLVDLRGGIRHKLRWLLKELEVEDRKVNYVMCSELERVV